MRQRATLLAALALTAIGAPAAHGASTLGPEAVDARFGSCGVRQVRIPSTASAAQRVAIAADGSAVIAGTAGPVAGKRDRLLLQRLRPDGSVDRSFAGAGVNVIQIPPAQGRQQTDVALTGLAIATDGKIVVSGSVDSTETATELPSAAAVLARFNADGTPDGSFGSGGFVVERLQGSVAKVADVAIAPDGKILAAGVRDTALPDDPKGPRGAIVVARFNPDGSRDPTFASNGVAAPDLGDFKATRATAIRLLSDGRILVAGQADEQFALARLTSIGELDPSFAAGGVNVTSPPGSSSLTTIEVDGEGRIVAAGTATNINAEDQLVLTRYLPQGMLDPSFGASGFTVDRRAFLPEALALLSDGKILATGKTSSRADFEEAGTVPASGLLRYSANGKRDASFGAGGALAFLPYREVQTNDVALAPDGTALAPQTVGDTFTVARFVVGQPALAAIAGLPRICRLTLTDKSISKVLRSAGKRAPSLRAAVLGTKPADLRIEATVQVGGRRAKLKTTTQRIEGPGFASVQLEISRSAAKLLRGANQATVQASARATDGGPAITATGALGR